MAFRFTAANGSFLKGGPGGKLFCKRVFSLVVPILKIAPTVSPDHNIKKFAWDHDHLADGLSFDKFLDV